MHEETKEIDDENHLTNDNEEKRPRKRKLRRVRSLIKTSIDRLTHEKNSKTKIVDKRPFPFGQCRVCTDKATGAHYGVPTCEGCKGFFKRSILRKEKYRCYFGDQCLINSDNRNRCKSCRFQKCLTEGMSIDGVRMGRIPKLVKEKALAECLASTQENDEQLIQHLTTTNENLSAESIVDLHIPSIDENILFHELSATSNEHHFDCRTPRTITKKNFEMNFSIDETKSELIDDPRIVRLSRLALTHYLGNCEERFTTNVIDMMKTIVTKIAHPTTASELDYEQSSFIRYLRWRMSDLSNTYNNRTKQLIERMNEMIRHDIEDFPGQSSSLQDIWAGLTDAIPSHVKNLIAFAREMPAVNEIGLDDFHKMMNNRLFDFWLIKHAPLIRNNESYMMLPNGLQYTRQWMTRIIGEEMVQTMFEFARKLNNLQLTDQEHALIFPAVICVKDDSLRDQETIQSIQFCYFYALYNQMLLTRNQSQAKEIFLHLLQIFAYLPLLNELQEKRVGTLVPPKNSDDSD